MFFFPTTQEVVRSLESTYTAVHLSEALRFCAPLLVVCAQGGAGEAVVWECQCGHSQGKEEGGDGGTHLDVAGRCSTL